LGQRPSSGARAAFARVPWSTGLGTEPMKLRDRYLAIDGNRPTKCLDAFKLVHGLGREIGLSAVRAGPHRDTFNDEERSTATEATSDLS